MRLEYFIARRTARPTDGRRRGVMVRIAELSVSLSVAAMILAWAVVMGFKREITDRMTGFMAHIEVTDVRGTQGVSPVPVERNAVLEEALGGADGVVSVWPYALREGVVKNDNAVQGVLLKGVDGRYDWQFFDEALVEGELPRVADSVRNKDILLSRLLADRLAVGVGERIEMLFVDPEEGLRRDRFRIAGIYATGMEQMDESIVLTDLRNVQRLAGWSDGEVSGFEIRVADFERVDEVAQQLSYELLYGLPEVDQSLVASSVKELYPSVFDWMKAHDVNAAVLVVVMLVVAFFNMASALMILVLERTRMIGLLKALGMTNGAVQRIFLWQGLFITLRGLCWGNLAGLGCCFVQHQFHLLRLDAAAYLLSEVPVAVGWGWWIALNVGVVAVILLLLMLPARVVATVKPSETIRYEA